jgi:hypothetical protein
VIQNVAAYPLSPFNAKTAALLLHEDKRCDTNVDQGQNGD